MKYQIVEAERSGVASNGVGLLHGQPTKRDSISLVEGVGGGAVYK
jgi:hypothetical protein